MLAEVCAEDCGLIRTAVHRVLDAVTGISDSPIVVVGVLLLGMVSLWVVVAWIVRMVERALADLSGGDLLRPRRGPGAVDSTVDGEGPDRPLIGRLE